jgi:signal transduction histidine kinase/integral membrane sensor domain MASE1
MTVQAAPLEQTEEPASADGWGQLGWLALGTAAYFGLGILGRTTIADGEVLSLVWPAAGVAMLFFGLAPQRLWWLVSALVAVTTVALNLLTGATGTQAGIFVVSNVAQAIAAVLIVRALAPRLWGAGGDHPMEELDDFWPVLAGSIVGSFVGAVVGAVGHGLFLERWSLTDLMVWWGRNTTGCVVIFTTVVLGVSVWQVLQRSGGATALRADLEARGFEAILLLVFTAVIYVGVFGSLSLLPVAFPLLVPTVWAGLRFSAFAVALHSLAVCTTVVVLTMDGRGAFAAVGSWSDEVLVSQLFIGLVFCLGILLSLGRGERLSLTATLSRSQAVSESQAEVLEAIIDTMHDGLTVIDETGQVLRRNPAGAEMLRTEADRMNNLRESNFTLMTTEGQVLSPADYPWVRAIAGENVVNRDLLVVFDDGSPSRTLAVSARRLPTSDSHGVHQAVVIYHDVTADRAQRTALESFAGVVAHDLRGPLSVIDGWAELLAHDLETRHALSPEDASPKVQRIRSASQGMHRLIDDLLESSISREQQLRTSVVDLESMARSVAEQRASVTNGPMPQIQVGDLPDAYADAALVRQVLDNLIANAVKYVSPGAVPRVTITGREIGDQVEITVADEGIGIPAAERDQVFEAFHRAHDVEQYDGHGIGLALCKKIVERHGGRIAARPPLGPTGARIVFTLPAVRPV